MDHNDHIHDLTAGLETLAAHAKDLPENRDAEEIAAAIKVSGKALDRLTEARTNLIFILGH